MDGIMKRIAVFFTIMMLVQIAFSARVIPAPPCTSISPPFIATGVKPNILIILDNSNSMDEDFYGNAVGSYSESSKSVVAKQALRNLVDELKTKANVGIMTFTLPSGISNNYLYNSPYFASYNPNTYCANPPDACVEYCITGNAAKRTECESGCQTGNGDSASANPLFSADFTDAIISSSPANGTLRTTYCPLIYPKTQRIPNGVSSGNYIYYKGAYPMYSSSSMGADYLFGYSGSDCSGTTYRAYNGPYSSPQWNVYKIYSSKTGTSDNFSGYSNLRYTWELEPTDTDYALGYYNFGQRLDFYYVGRTWFSNSATSSPQGTLRVGVGDLTGTTQYNNVMNMLDPKSNDSSGYMGCSLSNKNSCSYIINAGLTPSAGTLKAALDYFNGSSSPISLDNMCQKSYIIFVTDGLPSVKMNGQKTSDLSTLMPEVITELSALQTDVVKTTGTRRNKTTYNFPVKTYILGMGLSDESKANLDQMAVAGGTATPSGHAYYADNPTQLIDSLETIATDLLGRVASGSSISILSEGQTQMGANMLQGVFYPTKYYGGAEINWPGYLYNYWFYNSTSVNNIREDTVHDYTLQLDEDYGLTFNFDDQAGLTVSRYADPTASGDPSELVDTVDLDALSPIWEAGKILFKTAAASRKIYMPDGTNLVNFVDTNAALTTPGSSLLGSVANLDPCLAGADNAGTLKNLINYVRGVDITGCRTRTVGLCYNSSTGANSNRACQTDADCSGSSSSTCQKNVWKLGDIIYSSPQVRTDYKYCANVPTDPEGEVTFNSHACSTDSDCSTETPYTTCKKKENVVFVGANDGMLHAFKTGILTDKITDGVDPAQHQIEKTTGIPNEDMGKELWAFIPKNSLPYLRCLAVPPPGTCHLYFNDLRPFITTMNTSTGTKTVLIGGMRMGGGALDSTDDTYCMNATGQSNGQACTSSSQCTTAPYNAGCSTAYHFNAPADTCTPLQCSNPNTCFNPSNCTGLSAYYALDITDVESPKLLWEFTHPFLGYSYSGPALIHKWSDASSKSGDRYYVLFLSGPTDSSDGSSIQNVKSFVLTLGDQLGIDSVYVHDFGNDAKNGFGGRLFTSGVDVNSDGYTDFVFFGYGYSSSGNTGDWKGGVGKINTNNTDSALALDAADWTYDVQTYANIAQLPITAKVEAMKCFNTLYLYAGTGRYFFPQDDYGPSGESGKNFLIGFPFTCDQYNNNCLPNINHLNDNKDACSNLQKNDLDQAGWQYTLDDAEGTYLKERMITDPSISTGNKIFLTTTEPTSDPCGYGGRTRVWGLNCATGAAISDTSCTGYVVTDTSGTVYLQTSTGAINKFDSTQSFSDTSTENRTTPWTVGIPPENSPPVVQPVTSTYGHPQIMQWIEK